MKLNYKLYSKNKFNSLFCFFFFFNILSEMFLFSLLSPPETYYSILAFFLWEVGNVFFSSLHKNYAQKFSSVFFFAHGDIFFMWWRQNSIKNSKLTKESKKKLSKGVRSIKSVKDLCRSCDFFKKVELKIIACLKW